MAVGAEGCDHYPWVLHASVACFALISIAALLPWLERVWWLLKLWCCSLGNEEGDAYLLPNAP